MIHDLKALDAELNAMIQQGQILETLPRFYAETLSMQEGATGAPTVGRDANHQRLSTFLGSLKGFNGATLHASSVGDGITMSEWTFDLVGPDGQPMIWNEVIRRRWENGRVVDERYYNP